MANPVVLVNSATGSDSCGNATLRGTSASTDVGGTTVTLDGSPNLSGVATDGTAWIQVLDATAGHRNFSKITAADNSAKTVTVNDAFTGSLSGKTWAINQTLASIGAANSRLLFENNSASGDAMPGWAIELASGHTETLSATLACRRAGDTTSGRIILRGASGAATRPLLTFSNNGDAFNPRAIYWDFRDFEMRNTNATKTASIAFDMTTSAGVLVKNVKVSHSTNKFWQAVSFNVNGGPFTIEDNEFGNCAGDGIVITAGSFTLRIVNNWIYSCGGKGMNFNAATAWSGLEIAGNIVAFNTSQGLKFIDNNNATNPTPIIAGNVFHGNGSDGIEIASTSARVGFLTNLKIENNQFSLNGGYGLNFSGSGITDAVLNAYGVILRSNVFFSNTTNKFNPTTLTVSLNELTTDPSGGLATSTKDYAGATGGSNFMSTVHKAKGYPIGGTLAIGGGSSSYQYLDIGLQHQDSGGGGVSRARAVAGT